MAKGKMIKIPKAPNPKDKLWPGGKGRTGWVKDTPKITGKNK